MLHCLRNRKYPDDFVSVQSIIHSKVTTHRLMQENISHIITLHSG